MKVAELMAQTSLLQEKRMIQNEAVIVEMKERIVKVQARARACTSIALDDFHEGYQQQTLRQQKDQKQFHIRDEVDFRHRISQKTESVLPPCKNSWDKFDKINTYDKIKKWPQIKTGDYDAYKNFRTSRSSTKILIKYKTGMC